MEESRKAYGWGLIGPGHFAREFAAELVKVDRARPVAVASRSASKAKSFAKEFGFEKSYGSYEELFADPEVGIVYIVVPHVFHADLARAAIKAGKAVLCEKPLTPDPSTTRELAEFSQRSGVFLMEAMKTGFLPALRQAKKWIDEGRIGKLKLMKADFCFSGSLDPEGRLMNRDLAGGAVLDVGIYPLYLARFLLGEIAEVSAYGSLTETGVEDSATMMTKHIAGASTALTCSFNAEEAMSATVVGSEGKIVIPNFHAAKMALLYRKNRLVDKCSDDSGGMVAAEIRAVMNALDLGLIECPGHSHEDSVRLSEIMHEVRRQVGSVAD